jgi:hypothetical protein
LVPILAVGMCGNFFDESIFEKSKSSDLQIWLQIEGGQQSRVKVGKLLF